MFPMVQPDNSRPIGNTPITDAAAATAPQPSSSRSAYAAAAGSNADIRTGEDDPANAAATATGADIDNDHADERPVDRSQDAPESYNAEQDDEPAQAQTVAADASSGRYSSAMNEDGETERGGMTNPAQIIPDDEQDVVDHMNQMERSGRIDMGAFDGERNDDDDSEMLGQGGLEPGESDEHGNRQRNDRFTPVE
jgi:hypothetical protein